MVKKQDRDTQQHVYVKGPSRPVVKSDGMDPVVSLWQCLVGSGENIPLGQVVVTSGELFRFYMQRKWQESFIDTYRFDMLAETGKLYGYQPIRVQVDKWDATTAGDVKRMWKAVTAALDAGKPVMATGFGDIRYSNVLVSYDTEAQKVYLSPGPLAWWSEEEPSATPIEFDVAFFLRDHKGTKGFTCTPKFDPHGTGHACDVGFFWLGEKVRKTPPEPQLLVSALTRYLPEMLEDRPVWNMPNGLAGLRRWAGTIALDGPEGQWRDDLPRWPAQDAGWYFESTEAFLKTTRPLAANYLDSIADRKFEADERQALHQAAVCYRASAKRVEALAAVARPQPTEDINEERRLRGQLLQADPETRRTAAALIRGIYAQEKAAVDHLITFSE